MTNGCGGGGGRGIEQERKQGAQRGSRGLELLVGVKSLIVSLGIL